MNKQKFVATFNTIKNTPIVKTYQNVDEPTAKRYAKVYATLSRTTVVSVKAM